MHPIKCMSLYVDEKRAVRSWEAEQAMIMIDSYLNDGLSRDDICYRLNHLGFTTRHGNPFTPDRLTQFISRQKKNAIPR
jgi:hypothetical protein